jgi:LysR family transcriptional regulator for metE and metH
MGVLERVHLEILRAVQTHGSMTAAGEALHLTQSALSHSIKKLEDHLGVELWYREGRSLRPTKAGEYLLAVAQRLVPQLEMAEERLGQFARGERGTLRIGLECHPCSLWLLKVTQPFLEAWPSVDLDVRQRFQFGGLGALFGHEIDLLVTPDPLFKPGIRYEAAFDYEQVLVVGPDHPLRRAPFVRPEQLADEVLFTYPVPLDRLDIFTRFLTPAGIQPRRHKTLETTEIMVQMVAGGRGVAALPRWLVEDAGRTTPVFPVRLGDGGVAKQIFVGFREEDAGVDYVAGFLDLARVSPRYSTPG